MSDFSIDGLRARAAQYREMVKTATEATAKSLLLLAERFEELAKQLEAGNTSPDLGI